ncbi:response regulator [Clostridium argentinense CDC 2741]|uniref:Stage 0 sporulation protein A homolog n=1 Tax=Clostridium argentinense CDC 2741 TaxID=1418104 RepID=A0A0C1QVY2_9CLOT|nr:response regulator transcription factor [Clostridium argentinense]ARC84101.1 DNA-binding response regulator [Clostridium argentinense]KIE45152.1 response regulator [Clostridium argentinense CDC 2741]NFF39294.1 response regulator transcription factor [Clostridium argentinense]NFP51463.1 response regulator transcription factor [Clostridium argentinense]NFP74350.1 response regulator transcription factor [Clostridium argentinense]
MARILIVEDETSIRKFLKISLKRENFDVIEAASGEDGIKKAREESPDVVILDIMLPGIDGFKVCEILKKEYEELGIIMLTARGQDTDRIMGLEFGADHYLVKPFNPLELIAIINSLLRRIKYSKKNHDGNYLYSSKFKIDLYSKKIYKNDIEIDLTPKEYMLMKIFMENPNKAFSRDELLDMVWGYNYIGENKIIDVNIRRIRSKIEDNPSEPKFIETIWGTGYRWKEN